MGKKTRAIPFLPTSSDVDDVHDMMDDIQEQNEIAEEITSALSTPIGFNQEIDDVSHRSRTYDLISVGHPVVESINGQVPGVMCPSTRREVYTEEWMLGRMLVPLSLWCRDLQSFLKLDSNLHGWLLCFIL